MLALAGLLGIGLIILAIMLWVNSEKSKNSTGGLWDFMKDEDMDI